jgi:hypothetical protein
MTNSIMRKTMTTTTTQPQTYYEADATTVDSTGSVPFHTHTCIVEGADHTWRCNSPYCNHLIGLCPDHGGEEPIKVGREPWRGR